jgi:DNA-binding ferritin-like protein
MKTKHSYTKKTFRKSVRNQSFRKKSSDVKIKIVNTFLEMLHTIKLYHWNTKKYPEHKATDELYEHLNEHIDRFVEIMLGKDASRIHNVQSRICKCHNSHQLKQKIHDYQQFLINMNQHLDNKRDTDLLNVRDEILADLNQFLYLLTLH